MSDIASTMGISGESSSSIGTSSGAGSDTGDGETSTSTGTSTSGTNSDGAGETGSNGKTSASKGDESGSTGVSTTASDTTSGSISTSISTSTSTSVDDSTGTSAGGSTSAGGCGDGGLDSGEACDDGNTIDGDGCDEFCQVHKVVFVTSTLHSGKLGGLAGGDAICQARAEAAGLAGSFKAWLSTSASSAAARSSHFAGPYKRRDGAIVADSWSDLTDGTLKSAVDRSEFNQSVAATSGCDSAGVWTNTASDATAVLAGADCEGWTSDSDLSSGHRGRFSGTRSDWTDAGICLLGCGGTLRLYCLQQ